MSLCQQKESLGVIFCDSLSHLPVGSALALCPVSVDVGGREKKKLHVQGEQASSKPKAILSGSLGGASDSVVCPELWSFPPFSQWTLFSHGP